MRPENPKKGFVQVLLCWDNDNPESVQMVEKLRKGFDKMGCWHAELPPKDSIYKLMLTIEPENMAPSKER